MDSPSSSISGSPPRLDPAVLDILNSFLAEKEEEERRFKVLEAEHDAARVAGIDLTEDEDDINTPNKPMVSVAEYKRIFAEDWQLSQFWYSEAFSEKIARLLHTQCDESKTIAFLCCPTAFVAFQHMKQHKGAYLFEVDKRFAVLSHKQFISYDLDTPDIFPDRFKSFFDFVIADPPFLNEVTNRKLITTFKQIMKPEGRLLLITSTSVEDVIERLYTESPIGPLRRTSLYPEHGQLANDFAAYGSWEGAEEFGKEPTLPTQTKGTI